MSDLVPVVKPSLTPAEFGQLADVPPELEWLANLANEKTRRAYRNDVAEFLHFAGLKNYAALRAVARAHVIAWRKDLEERELEPSSIRRKLSSLSSLFDYLCERNAVAGNPVDGVKRPAANGNEGSTPALGDAQARKSIFSLKNEPGGGSEATDARFSFPTRFLVLSGPTNGRR